jgi:hypothetical protein
MKTRRAMHCLPDFKTPLRRFTVQARWRSDKGGFGIETLRYFTLVWNPVDGVSSFFAKVSARF